MGSSMGWRKAFLGGVVLAVCLAAPAREASACGCFAPMPDVSKPVIQAGERILFTVENGQVTADIQIQWSGEADEFGWLLPLPSVPTLEAGTDELFAQLQARTDPVFTLTTTRNCSSASTSVCVGFGGAADSVNLGFASDMGTKNDPLVLADSVGPYDYAVLKADDKKAMLDWLSANHFFVPSGTDDAVIPYIHPGAYFLALKLKSGKSTGDIQPVVVHYASDLPMIPIQLTAVGAAPHMGILVWVLGMGRAIPRNYHHTVLDEAALDWSTGLNYNSLLLRAVAEAPDHHTFITEYAGSSSLMRGAIAPYNYLTDIAAGTTDALKFAAYLHDTLPYPFVGPIKAILAAHIPEPTSLAKRGISADQFYTRLYDMLETWRRDFPNDPPIVFDAGATAREINQRIVAPRVTAAALFTKYPYLTRLHTALSPSEMTADPVFSFNASLPEVSNQRSATLTTDCDGNAILKTFETETEWPNSVRPADADSLPASLRIETLRESGAPEVVTDNAGAVTGAGGCMIGDGARVRSRLGFFLMAGLGLLVARLHLRSRRRR